MNLKIRKISYKMYLSAQGLILAIGVCVLIWNIIAAIHDLHVASKGKECVQATLGKEFLELKHVNLDSERWDDALEKHAQSMDHPAKRYALRELLERKCSEYLRISIYESLGTVSVYTSNYINGYPASFSQRAGYIGLTMGVTIGIMSLLFGVMKWISWLLRD